MAKIQHRIGGGGAAVLIAFAVLFDLIPLAGFVVGFAFLGAMVSVPEQAGKDVQKCEKDSGMIGYVGMGGGGMYVPGMSSMSMNCVATKAPGVILNGLGAAAAFALAPTFYFIASLVTPIIAVLFFGFVFLFVFHYNALGFSPRKVAKNLATFLGKSIPFFNLLPWITITTILHIRTCHAEDKEKAKQTK